MKMGNLELTVYALHAESKHIIDWYETKIFDRSFSMQN